MNICLYDIVYLCIFFFIALCICKFVKTYLCLKHTIYYVIQQVKHYPNDIIMEDEQKNLRIVVYYSLETLNQIKFKIDQRILSRVLMNNPFGQLLCTNASFLFSSVYKKEVQWERQDSNLRRKTSTDLQSVAFDRSATLPFPGLPSLNGF